MTVRHARWVMALMSLLTIASANADLLVIYDNGQTRSMDEFLGPVTQQRPVQDEQAGPSDLLGAADPANLLPIRSPGLTPGDVNSRDHSLPFSQAFFLIGADIRSQHWLQRHRERLLQLHAVGLLVQAESIKDLETVSDIAAGLPITPASGTDIAKALDIAHYPFAISDGRIWQ